jgi:hypothetical protein
MAVGEQEIDAGHLLLFYSLRCREGTCPCVHGHGTRGCAKNSRDERIGTD